MRKRIIMLALAVVMLAGTVFMTGCGKAKNDGDTLVYGSQDYSSINPALYEHGEINALIFAGLTAHDENNKVVPGLAESWDFDEATLTYHFKLKKDLTFHDGKPLTSADVKFTLETILDEKNQSEIVSNYKDIESIDCPDESTVQIKLKTRNIAMPDYLTIGILPKHLLEGKDLATDDFNKNPVGAGPYKLKEWDKGQAITLEKFDGYYAGTPNIGTVIFKIVPDDDAKALQIESGDIDMAQVTPKAAEKLKTNKEFTLHQMKTADYRAIAYNFKSPLFKENPELANILSYGIDREAIIQSVLLGQGQAAYSPLQLAEYNNAGIETFAYDGAKCESLLQAAGWAKGSDGYYAKNGQQLKFTISAMENDQVRVEMAKICAKNLQDIGVNADAQVKAELDWENQDACIIGWGSPFDPDDHTYKVFTTGAGDNYTGYSNPAMDKTLTAAREIENNDERIKLYQQFQTQMTEQMPYTFIAYVDANYAIKNNISGITEDTVLGHHGVGVFWNIAEWKIEK